MRSSSKLVVVGSIVWSLAITVQAAAPVAESPVTAVDAGSAGFERSSSAGDQASAEARPPLPDAAVQIAAALGVLAFLLRHRHRQAG